MGTRRLPFPGAGNRVGPREGKRDDEEEEPAAGGLREGRDREGPGPGQDDPHDRPGDRQAAIHGVARGSREQDAREPGRHGAPRHAAAARLRAPEEVAGGVERPPEAQTGRLRPPRVGLYRAGRAAAERASGRSEGRQGIDMRLDEAVPRRGGSGLPGVGLAGERVEISRAAAAAWTAFATWPRGSRGENRVLQENSEGEVGPTGIFPELCAEVLTLTTLWTSRAC